MRAAARLDSASQSSQATIDLFTHSDANSCSAAAVSPGIAPSEWLIM